MENEPIRQHIHSLEDELRAEEEKIQGIIEDIEELDNLLSPDARELLEDLRPLTVADDVYEEMEEKATLGDQLADRIAMIAGSWGFILSFMMLMLIWVTYNAVARDSAFDPYPFILLNLALSTLAALQAPVILMSQNRQADIDRAQARNDYEVNLKAELEIADLHRKIDHLLILMQERHQADKS
ncbi:MAG: DUF1003 domain-containing protein [Anaerolineae bacterium]|nr:DUF1003 domain-containing protein [Anaerolineae bacterium]